MLFKSDREYTIADFDSLSEKIDKKIEAEWWNNETNKGGTRCRQPRAGLLILNELLLVSDARHLHLVTFRERSLRPVQSY